MITPVLGLATREGSREEQDILSVVRQLHHLQYAGAYCLAACTPGLFVLGLGVHRALSCLAALWDESKGSLLLISHAQYKALGLWMEWPRS